MSIAIEHKMGIFKDRHMYKYCVQVYPVPEHSACQPEFPQMSSAGHPTENYHSSGIGHAREKRQRTVETQPHEGLVKNLRQLDLFNVSFFGSKLTLLDCLGGSVELQIQARVVVVVLVDSSEGNLAWNPEISQNSEIFDNLLV
ncbi:hypothetical protein MJO28_009032 [Puccinia striiformis f. sp. tritici]|uniref:Uncharacterized protein n=1 Tax=Puccinia striiformis f. sp. tritici TaxID=168172 RepID=A0ACC0EED1_9BASI|nr:hypothetical protein MJO28_009032 [Puccinia striiformis f. sp. tritici]KAI7953256.1 hypothetical protein MJO29_008887 [Puccinia striiformis f. sp. tritici]